jgi:hypothetical protein
MCACNRYPAKKECSKGQCVKCCALQTVCCASAKHRTAQILKQMPRTLATIDEAVKTGKQLYVQYAGGSHPGSVRGLLHVTWTVRPLRFRAEDSKVAVAAGGAQLPQLKEFCVERCTRISAVSFVSMPPMIDNIMPADY